MKRSFFMLISGYWFLASGFSPAIVDVNNNGLSDLWEKEHNAGELFPETFDPQGNYDADGWNNTLEAAAGTNPYDPNPPDGFIRPATVHVPAVMGEENGIPVVSTPEAVTVSWPTLVGKQYTLLYSPDLTEGSWMPVDEPFIATGDDPPYNFEINDSDRCFWRVAVTDVDTDGDGMNDYEENQSGSNPSTADSDGDGLSDKEEAELGTDLNAPDTDDDELGDAEDAVPLDGEINWAKTPENRYVWIEQPTGDHTPKAVNSRGQILFEFSRPHPPLYETYPEATLENALWDSASQSWIALATSGQATSGKVIKLMGLSDQGYVFGLSHAFHDFHPDSPAVNVAGMIWKPSAPSPGTYLPPAYFMPAASWGQNNLVPGVELIGGVSDEGCVNCVSGLGNSTWAWEIYNGSTGSQNTTSLSALGYEEKLPGATFDATRSLMLLKAYGSGAPWRLNLHDGGQASEIAGLLPARNSIIGTPGSDINIAPSLKDNGQQRLWLAANYYAEGAYHYPVRLEKRAGTGTARWYLPPSMAEGAWKLNARCDAITAAKYDAQTQRVIPSKLWRNGKYTDINDEKLTSKPSSVTITHAIDLASNGIILAQATENGATKTGLLVPVEVSWQAIAGFDNVDDHIDPWTGKTNGNRIFPDFKNPDETTIRHKLHLIVKTSPALVGKTVYVKAFDVDDSTSEEFDLNLEGTAPVIDSNGKAGGDNLPDYLNTQSNGQFWDNTASTWGGQTMTGVVDANGETRFDFRVGMQPGNNYRVVASVNDESMYAGVQATDSAADKYLGPEPTQTGGASTTPLLTVWRRLWVENDSMEAIPVDQYDYKRNDLSSDLVPPVIRNLSYSPITGRTDFGIDLISDQSSFLNLENGRIIVQSLDHPVIDTRSYQVTVAGNHGSVPINSGYRLYDDDDFGLNRTPLPRNDLIDDTFKNVYNSAFIEAVDAANFKGQDYNPSKTVDFYRNHPVMIGPWGFQSPGVWDDAINLTDSKPLWVGNLIAGYQGEVGDDRDPNSEGLMEGITPGSRQYSIVYVENVRDHHDDILRNPFANNTSINSEISRNIKLTAAHEIGHMPGGGDEASHHAETMLMDEDGYGSDNGLQFSPKSILRFRKTNQWQQP